MTIKIDKGLSNTYLPVRSLKKKMLEPENVIFSCDAYSLAVQEQSKQDK